MFEGSRIQRCGARNAKNGYEVWYTLDERARNREVPYPRFSALYKSGVYASKVASITPGRMYVRRLRKRTAARSNPG